MIHRARTFEEAIEIDKIITGNSPRLFFASLFVTVWLLAQNFIVTCLKLWFFPKATDDDEIKSIVIYTVGTLGDNVVRLPAIKAVKKRYPKAVLQVLVNSDGYNDLAASEIFSHVSFIDKAFIINDHPVLRRGRKIVLATNILPKNSCDLFINLSPFGNRGWVGAVVRELLYAKYLGAKKIIGFKINSYGCKGGIFNKVIGRNMENEPRRAEKILAEIGITSFEYTDLLPQNEAAKNSILNKISSLTDRGQKFAVLNPGAKFPVQRWPPGRFGGIAEKLYGKYSLNIFVTGTDSERKIASEVVRLSSGTAHSLAGDLSLPELIELLRMTSLCITNDTGTMHLAAMIGRPTVAIFTTRESPVIWYPVSERLLSLYSNENCSYCYNDACDMPKCIHSITEDYVLEAVKELRIYD